MIYSIEDIIAEIRYNKIGIQSITLTDARRYAANAKGSLTYAGTLFTKKHVNTREDDEVVQHGNKQTNLSEVKRTLEALKGKGEVVIRFLDGECITGEIDEELTYDVEFNDDEKSNNEGWHSTLEECKDYIRHYNGTNESYFEDYKGGTVSIRCNETEEVVYEEEIK